MDDRVRTGVTSASWMRNHAWLPIPVMLAAIAVLWALDLRTVWFSPFMNLLVHYGSAALGVGFIVIAAGRSFLASGVPSVLMLGCGVLITQIATAAMPTGFAVSTSTGFAIYNISVLLSALCHFAGASITSQHKIRLKRPVMWLAAAYIASAAVMGFVIWLALADRIPAFFIDGQGGTLLRDLVTGAAVAMFLLTAGLLWQTNRRSESSFLYWYALGLVLLAVGLAGSMMISVRDSPLQWVTRFTQILGLVYMCAAALVSARENRFRGIALEAVEEAWLEKYFLRSFRQQPILDLMLRYGFALAAVAAAMGLRLALTAWVGPGLPTYVTFYPVVMVVSLLAGLGPGFAVTLSAGMVTVYWILPPIGQFSTTSTVDRLGLIVFIGMGLIMSVLAELYRRSRDKAAAYEREMALKESHEALRRQAELIDPVRAEIIAQEMQRVVRQRGGAPAPVEITGEILQRVPVAAGAIVAVVSALVLAGWVFELPALKNVLPGFANMKANTALCFLLVGVAMALNKVRAVRLICAGLVFVVAGLTLAEYIAGVNFDLDELLFKDTLDVHTIYAGRMVEATALGFLLICASLFLLKTRGRLALWTQQALALGAIMIGAVAVLGYAYDVQTFYRFTGPSSMALHTAVSFVILAAALLFARGDGLSAILTAPGPGAHIIHLLLPGTILLPAIVGWLRVHGSETGLFDPNFGTGLFALSMMFSFTALAWWTAHAVNRTDAARREIETQLHNQAELMNHAHEPLIVREPGGKIGAWNHGAEELYGWSAAETVGRSIQTLLLTENRSIDELDHELKHNGHWEGELVHTARDGRRITVESRQSAMRSADGRLLIMESNNDITKRKQAEIELRAQAALLEAANCELESFSYSVSHDLQAPLRAIDGYSRMILKREGDQLDEKTKRQFSMIRDNIKLMGVLIEDLLSFSRMQKTAMSITAIDMDNLVNQVWNEIHEANKERELCFKSKKLQPGYGDPILIKQVLFNLFSNAIKFTRNQKQCMIEISSYTDSGKNVYCIKDNGAGFDMAHYDKLFGVFQRLHSSEEYEGTGIGLAIVQRIIKRHGGKVWAEAEVGKGATFRFTLNGIPADDAPEYR